MRVLKPTGNYFLNVGDSFASHRSGSDMEINISKEERLNSLIKRNSPKKEVKSNWFQEKQKLLIPHRIAIALQEKGFILRQDIVWVKKLFKYPEKESIGSCMPMPVKDRFNTAQEYIFHFVKSKKYYYDLSEVKSPIKNSSLTRAESPPSYSFRNESEINPFKSQEKGFNKLYEKIKNNYIDDDNSGRRTIMEANPTNCIMFKRENQITTKEVEHFAKFPKSLVEMLLLCGCPEQGVCLDPFIGSGTTIEVCLKNNRKFIGIELNPDFVKITEERIKPLMEQMKLI
jgi:DNA modification methylase